MSAVVRIRTAAETVGRRRPRARCWSRQLITSRSPSRRRPATAGCPADRSISHLTAWSWLLLTDDEHQRFLDEDYRPYGLPKIRTFVEMLDLLRPGQPSLWPVGNAELERMAAGFPCRDDCGEC